MEAFCLSDIMVQLCSVPFSGFNTTSLFLEVSHFFEHSDIR